MFIFILHSKKFGIMCNGESEDRWVALGKVSTIPALVLGVENPDHPISQLFLHKHSNEMHHLLNPKGAQWHCLDKMQRMPISELLMANSWLINLKF